MTVLKELHDYGDVKLCLIEGKGRGIIVDKKFRKNETVLVSPVVVIGAKHAALLATTKLNDYQFQWPYNSNGEYKQELNHLALVLGLGSMVNNSRRPNADWRFKPKSQLQLIIATRDIERGEELLINYGWPEDYDKDMVDQHPDQEKASRHPVHAAAMVRLADRALKGKNDAR